MVRSFILFALVGSAIAVIWHGLGKPMGMPASPLEAGEKLTCISYAPFHGDQSPFIEGLRIPDQQIEADLKLLSEATSCVRTYAARGPQHRITRIAGEHGLKVLQGIWLSRNRGENRREIEAALELVRHNPGVIQGLIVGNETLLRGELSVDDLKTYVAEVRKRSDLPVSYADVWEFWLKAPELVSAVDFVTIHILPYWEDEPVAVEDAVAHTVEARERIAEAFAGKEIWIGEIGWPSRGRMREEALPSPADQARFVSGVVAAAKERGWKINLIEAFDQPWKRQLEGTAGGHWGLYDDVTREPKFRFGEPVSNHPDWQLKAGLGIFAAFLVFAAFRLGARSAGVERIAWAKDLAAAAIALASGLTFGWAAANLALENVASGDRLRGALMLALALVVPMGASFVRARGAALPGFAALLDPAQWRRPNRVAPLLAALLAATVVAAIHVALGLVFDPRYKDFPLAVLTGPIAALAILAFANTHGPMRPGRAEIAAAGVLAGSALFIVFNEGMANWQAVWFGALLLVLATTALRARAAPG